VYEKVTLELADFDVVMVAVHHLTKPLKTTK